MSKANIMCGLLKPRSITITRREHPNILDHVVESFFFHNLMIFYK